MECFGFSLQKARKDYHCDACQQINTFNSFDELKRDFDLTPEEIAALDQATANGFKIKKGEEYERWICKDGDIQTLRAIPNIAAICSKYKLWAED